ncbi:MAG TPA: hypothetical protein VG738_06485 [Chitinophagaceae bacterium]|nr:hypothetical protein [Chitinophagaceae bacterium]
MNYIVETAWARLVKLEDQLGQTVKLRGKAISSNGNWWFNYMGTDIYVENMAKLPNWTVDNDFRSMEITGTLAQEELPLLNSTSFNQRNATKMYYIVKNASWASIDELLLPELVYDKYGIQW